MRRNFQGSVMGTEDFEEGDLWVEVVKRKSLGSVTGTLGTNVPGRLIESARDIVIGLAPSVQRLSLSLR